jgi:hypothetical protein
MGVGGIGLRPMFGDDTPSGLERGSIRLHSREGSLLATRPVSYFNY